MKSRTRRMTKFARMLRHHERPISARLADLAPPMLSGADYAARFARVNAIDTDCDECIERDGEER